MAQLISDRRDIDFVLHEQLGLVDHEMFAEFTKKTVDLIVTEARNLAVKEILPTQKPGDEEGCVFDNGVVKVPESFHRAWDLYKEGEWLAMADDPEVGGQGMPKMVSLAANEYLVGANPSFMLYSGMTHGAAKLVEAFGTEEQKRLYMKKMFSGEWGGTMLLTEPEAGSDVGALTTSAKKNDDGTYTIVNRDGTIYELREDGKISRIIDRNDNALVFSYNPVGCLSRITNASGNYVDFQLGPRIAIESG